MIKQSRVFRSVDLGRATGQVRGQEKQPRAGGGSFSLFPRTRPAPPLTAAEIVAGLQRMAAMLDPDLAARKVAMDFELSRLSRAERTDDNG